MKPQSVFLWTTLCLVIVACGCSGDNAQDVAAPKMSREEALQKCFEEAGSKLEKALADGSLSTVSQELVTELDDFEDFVRGQQAEVFEKFHHAAEELQKMSAGDDAKEALQTKIDELKELSQEFLKAEG